MEHRRVERSKSCVLQLPISDPTLLEPFVDACIRDGVGLIAIVGDGSRKAEDLIDDLIVGHGSDESRLSVATTSHPDETVEEVMAFAASWNADVSLVKL
jgi:hypothetical protein